MLDIGAGNGYFVYLAQNEFNLDATGLELSKKEIDFANKVLNVHLLKESLDNHVKSNYSIITIFNVLERVRDPNALLNKANKRLKKLGDVVITIPNTNCVHVKSVGLKNWPMIMPPHHINIFTYRSLNFLLRKNGFQPIFHKILSTYPFFNSIKMNKYIYLLRKIIFYMLKFFNIGADHLIITKKI